MADGRQLHRPHGSEDALKRILELAQALGFDVPCRSPLRFAPGQFRHSDVFGRTATSWGTAYRWTNLRLCQPWTAARQVQQTQLQRGVLTEITARACTEEADLPDERRHGREQRPDCLHQVGIERLVATG